jgi:hypothetical protein
MRVLLDECLPRKLKFELVAHEVRIAQEEGNPHRAPAWMRVVLATNVLVVVKSVRWSLGKPVHTSFRVRMGLFTTDARPDYLTYRSITGVTTGNHHHPSC